MPIVDCGKASLHYELSGSVSAPCVVLSSSLGTTLSMWQPQVEALERHFRVLRYDMRGHGQSSTPDERCSIADLGQDVLQLLSKLDIDKAVFCGLSIGGVIGQWLAANASERLHGVILCNTAAKIGTREGWNERIEQVRTSGLEAIAGGVLSRWFTAQFRESHPNETARLTCALAATSPVAYICCCEALREMDQREMVKSITMPTLIIAGEYDPVTTVLDGQQLQAAISGSRLTVVPAAHISNIEAPEQFNAAVLDFLQEDLYA